MYFETSYPFVFSSFVLIINLPYLVSYRSIGHWPWRKRASKHATARCPASPRGINDLARVSRSSPSACRTRPLHLAAPVLWQATCHTWATCHRLAILDTCCPHRLPFTPHSATLTIPAAHPPGPNLTEDPHSIASPRQGHRVSSFILKISMHPLPSRQEIFHRRRTRRGSRRFSSWSDTAGEGAISSTTTSTCIEDGLKSTSPF